MKHSLTVLGLLLLGCTDSGGTGGGHAPVNVLGADSGASKPDASMTSTGGAPQSGSGGATSSTGGASAGGTGGASGAGGGVAATGGRANEPDASGSGTGGAAPVNYWDGSNGCALVSGTKTYCGFDMDPPGDRSTRYFCSGGQLVAAAPCPGACVNNYGVRCVIGSGSTGGSLGSLKLPPLACIQCRDKNCGPEEATCNADSLCAVVPQCLDSCKGWSDCRKSCVAALGAQAVDDYEQRETCFDTNCHPLCFVPDGG